MVTGFLTLANLLANSAITKTGDEGDPPADPAKEKDAPESDPGDPEKDTDDPAEQTVSIADLRKVRAEAAKYRKQFQKLQGDTDKANKDRELADMEEIDKFKLLAEEAAKKSAEAEGRMLLMTKRAAIVNAASDLGFASPADAASLIKLAEIDIDADGNVDTEAITEAVTKLSEQKPYLLLAADKRNSGGRSPDPAPDPKDQPKGKYNLTDADHVESLRKQAAEQSKKNAPHSFVSRVNEIYNVEHPAK